MSTALTSLWLPILVSAVVVFFASFVSWMLLPLHRKDFRALPDEDGFFNALNAMKVRAGCYMFPYCDDPAKMKDPAFKERWASGPHGNLVIAKSTPNFGRNLLLVFLFYVVLSFVVAYLAAMVYAPGEPGFNGAIFRFTATAAILGYVFGEIPGGIFFSRPLRTMLLGVADGVVYGLLTGAVFGWLWPGMSVG